MSTRFKDIIITTLVSILVTIISGYYFLYLGMKERVPTFHIEPARTVLIHKSQLERESLPLKNDVVSVFFYFFNQGKQAIKRENVYAPLQISVGNSNAKILQYRVLKVSRELSKITLVKDSIFQNRLNLDFTILEYNDGFVAQMIFEGDKSSQVVLNGGIEEATVIKERLTKLEDYERFLIIYSILIIMAVVILFSRRFLGPVKSVVAILMLGCCFWTLSFLKPNPRIYSKRNIVPDSLQVKEANPFPNGHPLPGEPAWDNYRRNIYYIRE